MHQRYNASFTFATVFYALWRIITLYLIFRTVLLVLVLACAGIGKVSRDITSRNCNRSRNGLNAQGFLAFDLSMANSGMDSIGKSIWRGRFDRLHPKSERTS
jgi:hypothetical protein